MLFSKNHFACRHAASTDETRFNLNGVHIEPDGRTVATDGHMLMTVSGPHALTEEYPSMPGVDVDREPQPIEPCILPAKGIDDLVKGIPKGRLTLPILGNALLDVGESNANGVASFHTTDLETAQGHKLRKIDGEYPSWRQVVRTDSLTAAPQATVTVNLALLERVIKGAKELGLDKGKLFARIDVFDSLSPVRFTCKNTDLDLTLTAIVMPIRGDSDDSVVDTCPEVTVESELERLAAEKVARVKADALRRAAVSEEACPKCRANGCDECEGTGAADSGPETAAPIAAPEPVPSIDELEAASKPIRTPQIDCGPEELAERQRLAMEIELEELRGENARLKAKRSRK